MTAALLFCLVLLTAATAGAAPAEAGATTERLFLWNEANSQMATAETADEFAKAAETYRKLIRTGVRNGPLFFNLGLALLQAERFGEALESLYRAERYEGSNEDIWRNMLICLAAGRDPQTVSLPWYRVFLFWHFGLPGSTRVTLAVSAFLLCWVSLLLRIFGARQSAGALLAVAVCALVVFGSSAVTTLHEEYRAAHAAPAPGTALQPAETTRPDAPGRASYGGGNK